MTARPVSWRNLNLLCLNIHIVTTVRINKNVYRRRLRLSRRWVFKAFSSYSLSGVPAIRSWQLVGWTEKNDSSTDSTKIEGFILELHFRALYFCILRFLYSLGFHNLDKDLQGILAIMKCHSSHGENDNSFPSYTDSWLLNGDDLWHTK